MKKVFILIIIGLILFNVNFIKAHGEETFVQAEEIINNKISCDDLNDSQLEMLGDYYMEQMHPGEAHEQMDEMMGGEGSESLKQMHINMGKAFYCGEHDAMSGGMMNMMMDRGMMGGSMMNEGMMGGSMMNGFSNTNKSYYSGLFGFIFSVLIIVVLVLLIVLLIKQTQKPNRRHKRK